MFGCHLVIILTFSMLLFGGALEAGAAIMAFVYPVISFIFLIADIFLTTFYNRFDYSFQKGNTDSVSNHTRHYHCSIMFLDAIIFRKQFYINLGNFKLCFSQDNKNHTLRHNKPSKVLG